LIPYTDFLYFGVLLYVTLPAALLSWWGRARLSHIWIVASTLFMLAIQYSTPLPAELWIVLSYALIQWIIARAFLAARQRAPDRSKTRSVYYTTIALSLAPLIGVKLMPLIDPAHILGFLGISYATFRSLDVIINVQDGLVTSVDPVQYLAFLLFFPTISAGPIDRYRRFGLDWNHNRTHAELLQDLDGAVQRIFRGLLYKFILAALIKQYWLDPAAHGTRWQDTVSYMYAYSLYLFFDFAGYSAFAIAISYVLGIHTPENFRRPFAARDIRDFWDRWHISLSWWFRDYIYTRWVYNATKGRWFKNRYTASYLGFFLTMGLMGLWHGIALNYIVYGLYHGTLLVAHDLFSRWNRRRQFFIGRLWTAASIFITFNAVCFGLLIFSGHTLGETSTIASLPPASTANITLAPSLKPSVQFTSTLVFRSPLRPTPTPSPRTANTSLCSATRLIRGNGPVDRPDTSCRYRSWQV
jgi:membrane protein involved in D-alanine export